MRYVNYLNPISPKGTALWTADYARTERMDEAEAVLVRSANMHGLAFPPGLLAVARAGAGVNNIPLLECARQGIVVFNTPGANANGVMELALCGMLLGSRDIVSGIEWVKSIRRQGDVAQKVEQGKGRFAGSEIAHKRLGVIGLGAIGGPLANAAIKLGMEVYGFDPFISIDAAWHLDSGVVRVRTREEIFARCDIISLHVPLADETRKMIDGAALEKMKDGVILLNFARDGLVDDDALEAALQTGKVRRYVTDFPNDRTANMEGVVAIPHLGASTAESEDNCARMAVRQVMNYLENGNIVNSVNYPDLDMGVCTAAGRIAILHKNIPNSLGQFTAAIAGDNLNIAGMRNASRGEFAYTMLDLDQAASGEVVADLRKIGGVLRVRVIR